MESYVNYVPIVRVLYTDCPNISPESRVSWASAMAYRAVLIERDLEV